ncbi:MAG: DUF2721 domain-containing protein [Bacteroidales bacterium]
MEELTLTTPSLLFSAVSLIMLAYTNRFLAYASLVRSLKKEVQNSELPMAEAQIANLRERLYLTRTMQILGISSLLLCVFSMFMIYVGWSQAGVYSFAVALLLLILSLGFSIREILISVKALEIHLSNLEQKK